MWTSYTNLDEPSRIFLCVPHFKCIHMLFYALVYSMDSGKLSENKDAERRLLFIYLYLSFSTNFQVSDVQSFFEMFDST